MQLDAVEAITLAMSHGRVVRFDESSFTFDNSGSSLEFTPQCEGNDLSEKEAVRTYGEILSHTITASPGHPRRLAAIARLCIDGDINNLEELHLRLERRISDTIYIPLLAFIAILLLSLWWLNAHT